MNELEDPVGTVRLEEGVQYRYRLVGGHHPHTDEIPPMETREPLQQSREPHANPTVRRGVLGGDPYLSASRLEGRACVVYDRIGREGGQAPASLLHDAVAAAPEAPRGYGRDVDNGVPYRQLEGFTHSLRVLFVNVIYQAHTRDR